MKKRTRFFSSYSKDLVGLKSHLQELERCLPLCGLPEHTAPDAKDKAWSPPHVDSQTSWHRNSVPMAPFWKAVAKKLDWKTSELNEDLCVVFTGLWVKSPGWEARSQAACGPSEHTAGAAAQPAARLLAGGWGSGHGVGIEHGQGPPLTFWYGASGCAEMLVK